MHEGKRKGAAVYWAAGFIVACYLAQTANCHRPKETGQRRGPTIGVREGTIVFGRGVESHVANGNRKAPSNASAVEDERAYQADSAGLSKGQAQDTSPKEASWKRMSPSLLCGEDQMKFRAVGSGVSQFAVDQGTAHPMPLSQVPSTCGYTMQRNSLALVMLVPYDGCNMVQEGGSYMLPMRWQGIPVSLWCNKPAEHPHATTSAQPHDPVPQTLKFPPPYWGYPHYHSVPTTAKPAAKDPKPMVQFPGFPWYLPGPLPTPAETTTTKPPTTQFQFPQLPHFPPYGPLPPFPHYHLPLPTPAETTTTKPPTTQFQFPHFPPYGPLPPFPHYHLPLPTPAETTTTKPPTTQYQLPHFPPYGPLPPFPHYHLPLPTPAETTTTKPPTTQFQFPQLPHFPPYGPLLPFPHYHLPLPTPAETTTTKPPTTQYQLPHFPPYGPLPPFPHYHLPLPTPAETTTTKPPTTQFQLPHFPPYGKFPLYGPQFPSYGPLHPFPHYHLPQFAPKYLTSKTNDDHKKKLNPY